MGLWSRFSFFLRLVFFKFALDVSIRSESLEFTRQEPGILRKGRRSEGAGIVRKVFAARRENFRGRSSLATLCIGGQTHPTEKRKVTDDRTEQVNCGA